MDLDLFYHSEKLQSTKTNWVSVIVIVWFYHSEKLQSTKTPCKRVILVNLFYHSEKLQSTKTAFISGILSPLFYHSEKLQSTKTSTTKLSTFVAFRYNKSITKRAQIIRPVLKIPHKKH